MAARAVYVHEAPAAELGGTAWNDSTTRAERPTQELPGVELQRHHEMGGSEYYSHERAGDGSDYRT